MTSSTGEREDAQGGRSPRLYLPDDTGQFELIANVRRYRYYLLCEV